MSRETKSMLMSIIGGAIGMLVGTAAWKIIEFFGGKDYWSALAFIVCFTVAFVLVPNKVK